LVYLVHWVLYALGARHKWLMNRERIQTEAYERYARYFEPHRRGNFDPRAVRTLEGIGEWMDLHARSIRGDRQRVQTID
jgi:hypothetical protein